MLTTSKDTETWKSFFNFSNFQDEKKCPQVVCQKNQQKKKPKTKKTKPKKQQLPNSQGTFHLQSVWDRQLKKLQWSDCNPIALIYTKINQL